MQSPFTISRRLAVIALYLLTLTSYAQTVRISEVVASNDTSLTDEDGDSSDWIELYNNSEVAVDLTGWHLTDDLADQTKWTFPNTILPAESFLVVFASDKDRAIAGSELHTNFKLSAAGESLALVRANGNSIEDTITFPALDEDVSYGVSFSSNNQDPIVLLNTSSTCTAHIPTSAADSTGWQNLGFDDSGWLSGTTGVGYETSSGYESLIGLNVVAMKNVNQSVYIRVPFTVNNLSELSDLTLKMKYDDGFAAYINGNLVASRNVDGTLSWNSGGLIHNDALATQFEDIDLSAYIGSLNEGANVLAIHGLNTIIDSSDLIFMPKIEAFESDSIEENVLGLLATPTPGSTNAPVTYAGNVETPVPFPARGFYNAPFTVTVANTTDGATIHYTTDGSVPTTSSPEYTSPISISTTTCLRVRAFIDGWRPSFARTDTYIFAAEVASQTKTTDTINGQVLDYGMDAGVLAKTYYDSSNQVVTVEDALLDIPTISLTSDYDNLYDPTNGIYVNATQRWEVPGSAELIYPDGTEGFHVNAGLRIRGGASRASNNPKHSFRIVCRSEYGDSKIKYPLFEDEGVDEYDKIDFRSAQNYSWSKDTDARNTFLRDVFARDSAAEMGQTYTRSRYYHLYLNGEYWGLFMTEERPVADFAAAYHGGDADDYDAIKVDSAVNYTIEAGDGNTDAYERLYNAAMAGFSNNADYFSIMGLDANGAPDPTEEKLLDVDNMIDYLLVIYYMAASDNSISWFLGRYQKLNNMYAIYNRVNPDGFKWIQHDSEHSMDTNKALDFTGPFTSSNFALLEYFNPMTLHEKLSVNPEYKIKFADRVYKNLENGGVLTLANSQARLDYRTAQIDRAIVANAARWGSTSLDRDTWVNAVATTRAWLARSGDRSNEVVGYLEADGLIPSVKPPQLSQSGGLVTAGTAISLSPQVPVQSTPYPSGVPHAVPGIIQAEDFDIGGANVAYYDTSSGNAWNVYRTTEDVDIEDTGDVGGGYNIGSTQIGEWLNYTVDVASAGDYEISVRVARRGTEIAAYAYRIQVAGVDATGSIVFDGTDGWQTYIDVSTTVGLVEGEQVITLQIEGTQNINYIEFIALGTNNLTPVTVTPVQSTIYYTIDGTDPRAIGGGIAGTAYSGPINITRPTHLQARALSSEDEWSALAEATYWTAEIPLAVTELMYHAPDGNAHDFIEVQNISDETVTLNGYKIDNAINFKFNKAAQTSLAPGDYLVVVDDIDAFYTSYPSSSAAIAGEYSGDFSNGGEKVDLEFRSNDLITFSYDDARNWPQAADGAGHSLVPLERAMDTQESGSLDYGGNWRASSYLGGSPGEAAPELTPNIVINEIWAHTDTNLPAPNDSNDKIELYNSSNTAAFISGWYLSDSLSNTQKWLIPDTVISAGSFVVFDETDFHTSEINGFGLNKAGEQVVLSAPDRIVDVVRFKGLENAATGVTWGRYPDGDGNWMMTSPTHAAPNQVVEATVRISELMYHPIQAGNDYEYIVIENTGTSSHTFENATGSYRIDGGVEFTFPTGTSLNAGERLWILSFDPIDTVRLNLFCAAYGLNAANETFLGGYSGSLSNRGDRVALERPQDSDDPLNALDVSWVIVDEIFYFDQFPWPSDTDGTGFPLLRTGITTWGASTTDDTDADGMLDSWELTHFSSLTQANPDWDDDGKNNLAEYIADTDPTDGSSFFRLNQTAAAQLSWPAKSGRVYSVYWTDDLNTPFQRIATGIKNGSYTDTAHSNIDCSYYYITVEIE